jgi:hypothetical protein
VTGVRRGRALAGAALCASLAAGCWGGPSTTSDPSGVVTSLGYTVDDGCGAAGVIGFVGYQSGSIAVSGAEWCGLPTAAEPGVPGAARMPNAGGWQLHGDAYLCAPGAGTAGADGSCSSWTTEWRLCTATPSGSGVALGCVDFQGDVVCTATLTPQ